jgi:uncharacterized protein (TIGR03086 family)
MDPVRALESTYAEAQSLIDSMDDADRTKTTPCTEWDVQALVDHMVHACEIFQSMLAGDPPGPPKAKAGDDPSGTYRAAVADNLEAWRKPGATDTPAGVGDLKLIDINLGDAVAHTWDLGTALGRQPTIDTELAEYLAAVWDGPAADGGRERGAFGPRVQVPGDAPALDRLLGAFGRDPAMA